MMVWRYHFAAAADIVSFKTLASAVSSDLSLGAKIKLAPMLLSKTYNLRETSSNPSCLALRR
jgi:hypothetical protein